MKLRVYALTAAGRVAGVVAFAASSAYLLRALGAIDFSAFLVFQATAAVGSVVAAAGQGRAATVALSGVEQSERNDVWSQLWPHLARRVLIGSIAACLLTTVVLLVLRLSTAVVIGSSTVIAIAVSAVGLGVQIVASEALRALGSTLVANLGSGRSGGALTLVLHVLLIASGPSRWEVTVDQAVVLFAVACGAVALALMLCIFWLLRQSSGSLATPTTLSGTAVRNPVALVGTQLMSSASAQVDLFLSAAFLVPEDFAAYGIARRVVALILTSQQISNMAFTPSLASAIAAGKRARAEVLAVRGARLATGGAVVTTLVVFAGWDALASALGVEQSAGVILSTTVPLAVAALANGATGPCSLTLQFAGEDRVVLVQSIVGSLTTSIAIVCAGLLRPTPVSVASVVALTTALRFAWLAHAARRRTGVSTHILGGAQWA